MAKPVVIINLKTYKFGKDLLKLVKEIEKVDSSVIVCASAVNVSLISTRTKLTVFAQHVDPVKPGRHTGFVTPESLKAVGAIGVLINHSENRISFKEIRKVVEACRRVRLKTCIFAEDLKQAKKLKALKPNYLAIEPAELVASKTASISNSRPDLIKKIKDKLGYPFLVGAGVKSHEDLKIAVKLGASGVILSSAITTSRTPGKVLRKLIYG
ncbi:MAG: triose-phosphate isomerase [Nanoarchaeota archaeon]|nr:triose-phosphate isomerase [Nanoarchaeota archaeon]